VVLKNISIEKTWNKFKKPVIYMFKIERLKCIRKWIVVGMDWQQIPQ